MIDPESAGRKWFVYPLAALVLLAVAAIFTFVLFVKSDKVASGCREVTADWIFSSERKMIPAHVTLGTEPGATGLPKLEKTCRDFIKVITKKCSVLRHGNTQDNALSTFRLILAEYAKAASQPIQLEQVNTQELLTYMDTKNPELCGN